MMLQTIGLYVLHSWGPHLGITRSMKNEGREGANIYYKKMYTSVKLKINSKKIYDEMQLPCLFYFLFLTICTTRIPKSEHKAFVEIIGLSLLFFNHAQYNIVIIKNSKNAMV